MRHELAMEACRPSQHVIWQHFHFKRLPNQVITDAGKNVVPEVWEVLDKIKAFSGAPGCSIRVAVLGCKDWAPIRVLRLRRLLCHDWNVRLTVLALVTCPSSLPVPLLSHTQSG